MIADTCFIIDLMREEPSAVKKLKDLAKRFEPILITSPTIFELTSGLARYKNKDSEKTKINRILEGQTVVSFDRISAEKAGEIDGTLIKEGETIGPIDSMIAAIAITKKHKVLTRNKKDFEKIEGLEIESY